MSQVAYATRVGVWKAFLHRAVDDAARMPALTSPERGSSAAASSDTVRAAHLLVDDTLAPWMTQLMTHDRTTGMHSLAVAVFARDTAREMGWSADAVVDAYVAGLVHDIGKLDIDRAILAKPAKLTRDEARAIGKHPLLGVMRVDRKGGFSESVRNAVIQHHERVDGSGYPNRLRGSEITPLARLIATADGYQAMSGVRPYRQRRTAEHSMNLFSRDVALSRGKDPAAEALLRVLKRSSTEYRLSNGPEFGQPSAAARRATAA